jgi:hypothetical protein
MKLLVFVAAVLLVGCDMTAAPQRQQPERPVTLSYTVFTYDGCEYLMAENSFPFLDNYAVSITHKGDCRNPIHGR